MDGRSPEGAGVNKVVTFAIAAYNAERYLEKCLSSFLHPQILKQIEVLVVNDGSQDRTEEIGKEFEGKYPNIFRVISQENLGHGGALNTAVSQAKGKYFRPIDADDWVVTEQLPAYVQALSESEADAVLTGYHTVDMGSGRRRAFPCAHDGFLTLPELMEIYEKIASCCTFHGITYRTEFYRSCNIRLSEKIFYEDQEYASLPFLYVKRVQLVPIFLYQYQLGNGEQSVAVQNQVKRIGQIEQVAFRILREMKECANPAPMGREYCLQKLAVVAVSYHVTALLRNPDRKAGRQQSRMFYGKVEEEYPEVNRTMDKKLKILWMFHWIHLHPKLYQRMLDTKIYKQVRGWWR